MVQFTPMATRNNKESGRRRESFDLVAEDYNVYRSPYPQEVVDTVIAASNLHHGSRVLEIGCGTGQLSVPLAQHGIDLLALELGPHLAALARRNLKRFANVQVEVSSFEEWPMPSQKFDAVVSASAFHWLDPAVRFSKSAQALHQGGFLTILHVHHVRGGTPGFFADTQPYYLKWGLSDDLSFQPPAPDTVPTMYPAPMRAICLRPSSPTGSSASLLCVWPRTTSSTTGAPICMSLPGDRRSSMDISVRAMLWRSRSSSTPSTSGKWKPCWGAILRSRQLTRCTPPGYVSPQAVIRAGHSMTCTPAQPCASTRLLVP